MRKIKLLAVDFDNTVATLAEAHYLSLNQALETIDPKFAISEEEQVARFEGLSTRSKLNILVEEKGFPPDKIEEVFKLKQELTAQAIENSLIYDARLFSTFSMLKERGYLLFIASNAIRATIVAGLAKLGILDFFDKIISNEDVRYTKPHPEIYLKAMIEAGVEPSETLIIEDSRNGRESAVRSCAHVLDVNSPADTTYENIKAAIVRAEKANKPIKWSAKQTCNVLILASGAGSRMRARYHLPKPLIDVAGKPMIQRVVENLNIDATFTFVVQAEHCANYNLEAYLRLISPGCNIVKTAGLTSGAACSALLAKEFIDNNKQLLIANSDQIIDWNSSAFMYSMISSKADGQILTFREPGRDPKWSYVQLNYRGDVIELAEKNPISDIATIGIYAFNKGNEFVSGAERMIEKGIMTRGEYYLAPVYNELIQDGKRIRTFDISMTNFHPTGTIEDLDIVLNTIQFND